MAAAAPVSARPQRTNSLQNAVLPTGMEGRLARLAQWLAAVVDHAPGADDEPAETVAAWSNADVRALWIDASAVVQLMRNPRGVMFTVRGEGQPPVQVRYTSPQLRRLRAMACACAGMLKDASCADAAPAADDTLRRVNALARESRWNGDEDNYILRRGALLHSDIAMLIPPHPEPVASPRSTGPQRIHMRVDDGQGLDLASLAVHWEIARTLLGYVRARDAGAPLGRDDMIRAWYRATAAWMQFRQDQDTDHLDRARALFPDDPDIQFLSGTQRETYASSSVQNAIKSVPLPTGVFFQVGSDRVELRRAEAFFHRALELRPDMAEARIRYGRVLLLLGRHQDAAVELRQAVAQVDDGLLRYYGQMFLGAAEEADGRLDAARDAYAAAAALAPAAQSPGLALAALARRRGDRAAALRELKRVFELAPTEPERDDPWWSYHFAQARNARDLLDAVWKPFQRKAE